MKATTWLCPVLTLLCATRIVCTAQRGGYPLDYADTNLIQDDYFLGKRNKPSLSIVNPLDVLRQRLLLEIARRQMKENTRQVELNRAILKNVGKRMQDWRHIRQQDAVQNRQQQKQHFPLELEYIPKPLIYDFPQRQHGGRFGNNPNMRYDEIFDDAKKPLDIDDATGYQLNGNGILNEETNHMNGIGSLSEPLPTHEAVLYSHAHPVKETIANDSSGRRGIITMGKHKNNDDYKGNLNLEDDDLRNNSNNGNENDEGYHLQYLYNLHRNRYAKM